MLKNYLDWIAAIPLWKKLVFSIVSSFLTIIFNIIMAVIFNITMLIHTSNLILILTGLFLKKTVTLLFMNKLYYRFVYKNTLPPFS